MEVLLLLFLVSGVADAPSGDRGPESGDEATSDSAMISRDMAGNDARSIEKICSPSDSEFEDNVGVAVVAVPVWLSRGLIVERQL